jgi:fibronectin type 3 domain-containing protein
MRGCFESMTITQTGLRVFVLVSAVFCLPTNGYGRRQFAVGFSSLSSPVERASATMQTLGGSKLISDTLSVAVVPPTGNGVPQSQPVVRLTWKASTSPGVKYNVYRSGTKGECLKSKSNDCKKINSSPVATTSYEDKTVQAGQSYFYVTKAVSSGAAESGPSNEAQVMISASKP